MTEVSATRPTRGASRNPGGAPATLTGTAQALRERRVSSTEVVTAALETAERFAPLGIAVALLADTALAAAREADDAIAHGRVLGPLHGVPIGVKDIIFTADAPTTGQSAVRRRYPGDEDDAVVVARLRAAGAVINAKATTMEFAAGFPVPGHFPVPRNPWQPDRWPGGSSSGSGNGVAVGAFLGALGTDTAGSVRIPSAFCGITGLKPTFGRIPKSGVLPLAYSIDTVGPMARSAADCALMLQVLAGADPSDPSSVAAAAPQPVLDGQLSGLRIGIDRSGGFRVPGDDEAAFVAVEEAAEVLRSRGARIVDVELPHYREVTTAGQVIVGGEAAAFHHAALRETPELYGAFTFAALSAGLSQTAVDYVQAQRVRTIGQAAIAEVFRHCDAVLMPTIGIGAPPLDGIDAALMHVFAHIYTSYWNALGLPAISLPGGFTADGLPLGLQVAGRALDEGTVLRIADAFQRDTDWHLRVPDPDLDTEWPEPVLALPSPATAPTTDAGGGADAGGEAEANHTLALTRPLHALAENTAVDPAVVFTANPGAAS